MNAPKTPTASGPTTPSLSRDVTVRDASGRRDAYYLVRQWHHYYGAEYESDWLPNPPAAVAGWSDADGEYGAIASHRGTVRVGGLLASLLDADDAPEQIGPTPIDERALAGDGGAVYIWLIAVDAAWRDRGIATRLLDQCLSWANRETTAETVVAQSWQRREHVSSAPLFDRAGFERVVDLPDYYARSGRSACPDCGYGVSEDGECDCGTVLYAMDLARDGRADE